MDLDPLAGEVTWMLNRGFLLFDRIKWRPSHYVVTDKLCLDAGADEFRALVDEHPDCTFFFPDEVCLAELGLPSAPNVYWVPTEPIALLRPDVTLAEGLPLSIDQDGLAVGYTVTAAAIQLAAYLGYGPIYLIGCDTTYSVPPSDSQIHLNERTAVATIQSGDRADPNHFHPQYHRPGDKWFMPDIRFTILTYQLVAEACRRHGVEVFNATVGGRLEVFERVRYEDLW